MRPTINVPDCTVPCYIALDNFTQRKKNNDDWYSQPFYYSPRGYKMRLNVLANGYGSGKGTHVSIFVQILKGEYDDTLTWPYKGDVTFEIINWTDDLHHAEEIVYFDSKQAIAGGYGKKPIKENEEWGYSKTLSHYELYNSQYITNSDILYIRVPSSTM